MLILWYGFLFLTHFFCLVYQLECDAIHQYKSSKDGITCCRKCAPGERMVKRCTKDVDTVCKQCSPDFYMDEYSTELECKRCSQCTKDYMVYKVKCSNSSDAVCDCEIGYKCSGNPCIDCEKIPATAAPPSPPPPPPPPTTTTTTTKTSTLISNVQNAPTPSQDIVWITLSLCCVCILLTCFILISRTTPVCGWIMLASAGCFWRSEKTSTISSQCTEDEEVPMPVQEVCGYKEWQEDA